MTNRRSAFTRKDKETIAAYNAAEPKQFGDLHERMKYLMAKAQGYREQREKRRKEPYTGPSFTDPLECAFTELWHAIRDLETEVKPHTPAHPPYGRRTVKIGEHYGLR
jgi:hypothetical protein